MSRDDFLIDLEHATQARNKLQQLLNDYQRLLEAGESTARVKEEMRGGIDQFAVNVDALLRTLGEYEDDPSRYRITPKELERRNQLVSQLEDDLNTMDLKIKESRQPRAVNQHAPVANFRREGESETNDTRNMSNSDLAKQQHLQMKRQKETEEAIVGVTENLKNVALGIGDEADLHNAMLDGVEANIDHTQTKLDKTTYKVQMLIYKSNDCCLIAIVCILIAVLLVIIFAA